MADQDQNRSEAATPFKLEEARKRGSVPKSMDVNSLAVLLAGCAALYFAGPRIVGDELRLFSALLSNAHQTSFAVDDISALSVGAFRDSLSFLSPLFLCVAVLAVLSNFLQTGPVFSFYPLKPDLDKVNPIAGFKRLFSIRLLMEAVKTVLKFVILGLVLYFAVMAAMPTLMRAMNVAPASFGKLFMPQAGAVLAKLLVAMTLITILDAGFSRWEFARRMRMSKREIKDEVKRREGDPRVKARLRELQRETLKRAQNLGRIKDADVLITNPVHLAVAIKYDRDRIDAPMVLAKGAGAVAARMREMARRHRVPIVQNKPLARALFHRVEIEHAVPAEHYSVLAKILVWVYAMRDARQAGAPA